MSQIQLNELSIYMNQSNVVYNNCISYHYIRTNQMLFYNYIRYQYIKLSTNQMSHLTTTASGFTILEPIKGLFATTMSDLSQSTII